MAWYSGNIPQAITESQTKSKLLIVYISGKDEDSKKMDDFWEDGEVVDTCRSSCVCLKLEADSEGCKQFSAIYPVLCVPSAYFIGNNGSLMEAIPVQASLEELHQKVQSVVEKFKSTPPKVQSVTSTAPPSGAIHDESSGATSSNSVEPQKNEKTEEQVKEEVEKLQQKIQEKRIQEAEKKKELEKERELERRQLGQNLQKLKEAQKEAKMKQDLAERKRDKLEEKAARDRVRRQIEQDKIDRAERFKRERKEREEATNAKQKEMEQKKSEASAREKSLHARLQFRMPDGSTFVKQFHSSDLLSTVFEYVASQNYQSYSSVNSFDLAISFPRRIFSQNDQSQSLGDLGLSPSASLVILPRQVRSRAVAADNSVIGQIGAFFMFILYIPVYILQSIWSFVSGPPQNNQPAQVSSESSSAGGTGDGVRRRNVPSSMDVRRQGNMTRLSDMRGDDEDDATWNGNSTQQM